MTIRRYFQLVLFTLAQGDNVADSLGGGAMLAGIGMLYILPIGYTYVAMALLGAWWLEARERRRHVVAQST